jgi:hypothetical protein
MMIFNMSTSYFRQKFISLFWGLFNDETDLRVRYHSWSLLCFGVQTPRYKRHAETMQSTPRNLPSSEDTLGILQKLIILHFRWQKVVLWWVQDSLHRLPWIPYIQLTMSSSCQIIYLLKWVLAVSNLIFENFNNWRMSTQSMPYIMCL